MDTFEGFMERAAGYPPYPYQSRLALDGLAEVLRAPTGMGKTAAAVLPWLYRRRVGPSAAIRAATPRRLAVALPMRTLVEQTVDEVQEWLAALGWSDEVTVAHLMGGDRKVDGAWRLAPAGDAILIGTIDMLLSRALNRGYAMGKGSWPIDFGLVGNDVQWVFDEVQLMGPALPTSRQLQSWRDHFGTYGPTHSMWMSATLDLARLETVDAPSPSEDQVFELDGDDLANDRLRTRVDAQRQISRLADGDDLVQAVTRLHRPGTNTIIFHNTVARAQETYTALASSELDADVVVVHSRFRPPERAAAMKRVLHEPGESGTVVITTQALEAGVDITSSCVLTEVAPWSSIVQRAGRCNRYGEETNAQLIWFLPEAAPPYEESDLNATVRALEQLEGQSVTGAELAAVEVDTSPPLHLTLRRKDLVELFDTAPDLSGNDIDVSRFIRDSLQVDVRVAWRPLITDKSVPAFLGKEVTAPTRRELCAAPISAVRKAVKAKAGAPLWRFDHEADQWQRCRRPDEVVPGAVLLADTSFGRYDSELGWNDRTRRDVEPIDPDESDALTTVDAGAGDDQQSATGVWVTLPDHLQHAGQHARAIVDGLGDALPEPIGRVVVRAAQLHDIGKVHEVFQDTLARSAGDGEKKAFESGGPWAKSPGHRTPRHRRKGFSHALAGALALLDPQAKGLLQGIDETNLVRYLVGAHHGNPRLGIRSGAEEANCHGQGSAAVQGICDGEELPGLATPVGPLPATTLYLSPAQMGDPHSWTAMALTLRDRPDLGIFRLGFLEALVRMADWRASEDEAEGR